MLCVVCVMNVMLSIACCVVDFVDDVLCTVSALLCITWCVHAVFQSRVLADAVIGRCHVATNLVVLGL